MLGMGESQLYISILYWTGLDFKMEAIPLSMLLNVVNSATAATTYTIKKMVLWQAALPFAIAMLILPPVGAWLNAQIPTKPLIAFFAVFTATAATLILSGWKPQKGEMSSKGRILLGLSGGSVLGLIAGLIGRGVVLLSCPCSIWQGWKQKLLLPPPHLWSLARACRVSSLTWL